MGKTTGIGHTDALIVSGGPAGLSAASAVRQRGIACIVVEALSHPVDKACGEGLMPDALKALSSIRIELHKEDGYWLRGIHFNTPADSQTGVMQLSKEFPLLVYHRHCGTFVEPGSNLP